MKQSNGELESSLPSNPWPEAPKESITSQHASFEDNFTNNDDEEYQIVSDLSPSSLEANQNGLQLPESGHYLSVLGIMHSAKSHFL